MDGAAQDELVTDGPGQYIGSNSGVSGHSDRISSLMRSISPMSGIAASSGTSSSSSSSEVQMLPVAENWCHTQVSKLHFFNFSLY